MGELGACLSLGQFLQNLRQVPGQKAEAASAFGWSGGLVPSISQGQASGNRKITPVVARRQRIAIGLDLLKGVQKFDRDLKGFLQVVPQSFGATCASANVDRFQLFELRSGPEIVKSFWTSRERISETDCNTVLTVPLSSSGANPFLYFSASS